MPNAHSFHAGMGPFDTPNPIKFTDRPTQSSQPSQGPYPTEDATPAMFQNNIGSTPGIFTPAIGIMRHNAPNGTWAPKVLSRGEQLGNLCPITENSSLSPPVTLHEPRPSSRLHDIDLQGVAEEWIKTTSFTDSLFPNESQERSPVPLPLHENDWGSPSPDGDQKQGIIGSITAAVSSLFSQPDLTSHVTQRKRQRISTGQTAGAVLPQELVNTADSSLGARVIISTDDFFAPAKCMLNPEEPTFDPNTYGPFGKIMDGWETRRRRVEGHNWVIIRLAAPTIIKRIEVSTRHFTGNHATTISIEAPRGMRPDDLENMIEGVMPPAMINSHMHTDRTGQGHYVEEGESFLHEVEAKMQCLPLSSKRWYDLIPAVKLNPGYETSHLHVFNGVDTKGEAVTYLRLNQFPDGGIARLRVMGTVVPTPFALLPPRPNFASVAMGARIIGYSSAHFSSPSNLLIPFPPKNMASGWETARSRTRTGTIQSNADGIDWARLDEHGQAPAEWCIVQLSHAVEVSEIEISTEKFIGNYPESVAIDYADLAEDELKRPLIEQKQYLLNPNHWTPLFKEHLEPDKIHTFDLEDVLNVPTVKATHLKMTIVPDGGIARLCVRGSAAAPTCPRSTSLKIARKR